jgi:hypothetical protein
MPWQAPRHEIHDTGILGSLPRAVALVYFWATKFQSLTNDGREVDLSLYRLTAQGIMEPDRKPDVHRRRLT